MNRSEAEMIARGIFWHLTDEERKRVKSVHVQRTAHGGEYKWKVHLRATTTETSDDWYFTPEELDYKELSGLTGR